MVHPGQFITLTKVAIIELNFLSFLPLPIRISPKLQMLDSFLWQEVILHHYRVCLAFERNYRFSVLLFLSHSQLQTAENLFYVVYFFSRQLAWVGETGGEESQNQIGCQELEKEMQVSFRVQVLQMVEHNQEKRANAKYKLNSKFLRFPLSWNMPLRNKSFMRFPVLEKLIVHFGLRYLTIL